MGKQIDNTECYCIKIKRIAENMTEFYNNQLKEAHITLRQYTFLKHIHHHSGCTMQQLADLTNLSRSTLSRSLKSLFTGGYIIDLKKNGSKNSYLTLTEDGQRAYEKASVLWSEAQREIETKLGKHDLQTLTVLLEKLQDL